MKRLFIIFVCLLPLFGKAQTTYYVSAKGSDRNSGTSANAPFQTIAKVNSLTLSPGDEVLFKRGESFNGKIIAQAGSVTYGAYGSGARPAITGFSPVTSWTNLGRNIWESSSPISKLADLKLVVINGVNTPMGRTPDTKADGFRPSYFPFQSHEKNRSVTSSSLDATNWTGADICIRENEWTINKATITGQTGKTLNFSATAISPAGDGWGFWIQNDPRTLDQQNEWYFNPSSKKIRIYSKNSPTQVLVATVDTLAFVHGHNNVTFQDMDFEGANTTAIVYSSSNYGSVKNCTIHYVGGIGVDYQHNSHYPDIESDNFWNLGSCAYYSEDYGDHLIFRYDTIINQGLVSVTLPNDYSGNAINAVGANSVYQYNILDSIAHTGIKFRGSNVDVSFNYVRRFAMIRQDAGGIATGYENETGKQIHDNIVMDGIGNSDGTGSNDMAVNGIYCDDWSNNTSVYNNTVANIPSAGIFLHNAYYDTVNHNLVYNHSTSGSWTKGGIIIQTDASKQKHPTRNNRITNNVIYATDAKKYAIFSYNNVSTADSKLFGVIDSNYYGNPSGNEAAIFDWYDKDASGYRYYGLEDFRRYYGGDANSVVSPKYNTSPNSLRFVYNASGRPSTISLPSKYIDASGKVFDRSITLEPFSSDVLMRSNSR